MERRDDVTFECANRLSQINCLVKTTTPTQFVMFFVPLALFDYLSINEIKLAPCNSTTATPLFTGTVPKYSKDFSLFVM